MKFESYCQIVMVFKFFSDSGKENWILSLPATLILIASILVALWVFLPVHGTILLFFIWKIILENNFLLAGGEPMVTSQTAAIEMEIPCQYGDADVKFE